MPHPPHDVGVAVAIEVVAEDPDARGAELEVRMECPSGRPLGRLLVPSHRRDQIEAVVAVDVAVADAMARPFGSERACRPLDLRRSGDELVEEDLSANVGDQNRRLIAVEIDQIRCLHRARGIDRVFGPRLRGVGGLLGPTDPPAEVGAGDDVGLPVAVDVEGGIGEVFVVVRVGARGNVAHLVLRPVGRRVPGIAAEDIGLPIGVEIGNSDGLERRAVVDDVLLPGRGFFRPDRHPDREQEREEGNEASISPQEDHGLGSGGGIKATGRKGAMGTLPPAIFAVGSLFGQLGPVGGGSAVSVD